MQKQDKQSRAIEAVSQFERLPDSALIDLGVIRVLAGNKSRATIYNWMRAGSFPKPAQVPGRTNLWRVGAIRQALGMAPAV